MKYILFGNFCLHFSICCRFVQIQIQCLDVKNVEMRRKTNEKQHSIDFKCSNKGA